MSKKSGIIMAVGQEIRQQEGNPQDSAEGGNSPEEELVLQSDWEESPPENVLELGSDLEIEDLGVLELQEEFVEEPEFAEYAPSGSLKRWVAPALAVTATLGWTGFFVASHWQSMLTSQAMAQWATWISDWSVPVLLVGVAYLLAMRNSRSEANRFANTAAMLSREATALETRLTTVNRELSMARDFLGTQARELDSLGRIAADRLTTHAGALEGLITDNGAKIDSIASVSDTALANMEKLRNDLPVVANSAKDVSNQVGNVGRSAQEHLSKLVSGFERLNEFGTASERQVSGFTTHVDATIGKFEEHLTQLEANAGARFAALHEKSDAYRTAMDEQEAATLAAMQVRSDTLREQLAALREGLAAEEQKGIDAMQTRIAALRAEGEALATSLQDAETTAFASLSQSKDRFHTSLAETVAELDQLDQQAVGAAQQRVVALKEEAGRFDDLLQERDRRFSEEIARRQETLSAREVEAVEHLLARITELDETLSARAEGQSKRVALMAQQGDDVASKVQELSALYDSLALRAENATQSIGQSMESLGGHAEEKDAQLNATGAAISELTEASLRLLEILKSSTEETLEKLPAAIKNATELLSGVEDRAVMLSATMEETNKRSNRLSEYVHSTNSELQETDALLGGMHQRFDGTASELHSKINDLRAAIGSLESDGAQISEKTEQEISGRIAKLEEAIRASYGTMESEAEGQITRIAENYGGKVAHAIEQSLSERMEELLGRLEQKTAMASHASQDAVTQLRDELAVVTELAGNLEQRVARAREEAEEKADSDFARRMAQISERLNSNAIDITGALSSEVSDQAWASYLKGDRGIFTRKAVRLLDAGQSRQIVALYEADEAFQRVVNRYIHDFEAMLRSMLATRDGNSLSVTMLGSDMGKLYVALAQSIERLRA